MYEKLLCSTKAYTRDANVLSENRNETFTRTLIHPKSDMHVAFCLIADPLLISVTVGGEDKQLQCADKLAVLSSLACS